MSAKGIGQRRPAEKLRAGLVDPAVRRISYRVPRDKNAVPSGIDPGHAQTNGFSHTALHAISHDGRPYSPADRETEAAVWKLVSQYTQHRQTIAETPAPSTNFQKSLVVANPEASSHNSLRPQVSIGNSVLCAMG